MDIPLFEQVGELVRTLVPDSFGAVRYRSHRRGVKVWFGAQAVPRHHFEAQFVPRRFVDDVDGSALEVGFHAEDGDVAVNDAALARIGFHESTWRRELGPEPQAGPFLGHPDGWRRLSETWIEPDPDDEDLAFELASRLADYINVIQPILDEG